MCSRDEYKKPKTSSKPSVKAVTLKPKFLSKYYAADVPQNVIEEEIETSIDVWQKIKDKFNGLSIEENKKNKWKLYLKKIYNKFSKGVLLDSKKIII